MHTVKTNVCGQAQLCTYGIALVPRALLRGAEDR